MCIKFRGRGRGQRTIVQRVSYTGQLHRSHTNNIPVTALTPPTPAPSEDQVIAFPN